MITDKLIQIIIAGGSEWVMILLIILSIISIAVMIERWIYFRRRRRQVDRLDAKLAEYLEANNIARVKEIVAQEDCPALAAAAQGYAVADLDRVTIEKKVFSALGRERLRLEQRLGFLGTLGNNAPFIGLFGTVLGIIRAFRDLSISGRPDTSVVMAGISEALVATAIGLFVAIPAVLLYNYFQRHMDHTLSITEALAQSIIATVPAGSSSRAAAGSRLSNVPEEA